MIKIIHYIWLGGNPKSKLIEKCIASWRKYMPDWEIKEWNESNLDINCNDYVHKAYNEKKYAFASDYFRFDILKKHGGLYLDVDVEIIRPFEDLLVDKHAVTAFEYSNNVAPGLVLYASEPDNKFMRLMCDKYLNYTFENTQKGIPMTICEYTTNELISHGLALNDSLQEVCGITIYPSTFFCPTNKEWSIQNFSKETRCIHHYGASWLDAHDNMKFVLKKSFFMLIGKNGITFLKKIRYFLLKR